MKKFTTKLLVFLCVFAALWTLCPVFADAADENTASNAVYELYPCPHSVTYLSGNVPIGRYADVVIGETVDEYTVEHLYEALTELHVLAAEKDGEEHLKVLAGVYNSGDKADLFARSANGPDIPIALFEKTDAYLLSIADGTVLVLGKDSTAVYHGISTLQQICEQAEDGVLSSLLIYDYADTQYRGFIEGFYGVPWTAEQRIELMKFAGRFKTNVFISAPKNVAYYSSEWRTPYTDADLCLVKEQIEAGKASKTEVAFSVHPFVSYYDPITEAHYDKDVACLLDRLQQLYDAGARLFHLAGDDVSVTDELLASSYEVKYDYFYRNGSLQARVLNDVCRWLDEKGDCRNLLFVPSSYDYISLESLRVEPVPYFDGLMENLDDSVELMWTGYAVCSAVSQGEFARFDELSRGRQACMWLNWPANDLQPFLCMGRGTVLDVTYPDGNVPFNGMLTNLAAQAEASKIAIFATADYAWNINGFDCDADYHAAFSYIDKAASASLEAISNHLANAGGYAGRTSFLYCTESPELAEDIAAYRQAYRAGKDLSQVSENLCAAFEEICGFCDEYLLTASNRKLSEEIRSYVLALKRTSQALVLYLEAASSEEASQRAAKLQAANEMLDSVNELQAVVMNIRNFNYAKVRPRVGMWVIEPFLKEMYLELNGEDLVFPSLY